MPALRYFNEFYPSTETVDEWWSRYQAGMNVSAETIIQSAVMVMDCEFSGVYFLVKDSEIVYVGQSKNVAARIITHLKNGKLFNRFFAIPCLDTHLELSDAEANYIVKFNPPLNKILPQNSIFVSLSQLSNLYRETEGDMKNQLELNEVFPEWKNIYRLESLPIEVHKKLSMRWVA